jgi:ABC-type transporter Mla subunit MlaD
VIDELNRVFAAIDPTDLAEIFEALAEQRDEAEVVQGNIAAGNELAAFGARTAEQNLLNLRRLADIADELAPRADDLTRLNANLDEATAVLREREGDLSDTLDVTATFAEGLAEFLETSEDLIKGLMQSGDLIGAVLEDNADNVGGLVEGIIMYGQGLGRGGLLLDDDSEWAPFKVFLHFDFEALLMGPSGEPGGANG